MNNKVIVVNNGDSTCSIVTPTPEMFDSQSRSREDLRSRGIDFTSDEEVLNYIQSVNVPKGLSSRIVDLDQVPSDRTFRQAWTDDNNTDTVDIDITKAKEITKDMFRELRKPILESLDVESMKALESEDKSAISEIAAKKQELRDVTAIELPNDIEELKQVMPECLKDE